MINKINESKKKEENYKIIAVGTKMISLINKVKEKFKEEYGFEPTIINVTDLIARRVFENKLF